MKMLLMDSSYPINYRNVKIIESLQDAYPDSVIDVITWDRDGKYKNELQNYIIYSKFSPVGKRVQKLRNLYGYYKFIKHRIGNYKFIIASHWDMLMIASKLKQDEQILIYDDLDIPTYGNTLILSLLQRIESISLKRCDAIIFASRFYEPLYAKFSGKKFIIENKPLIKPVVHSNANADGKDRKFIISYIGGVRYLNVMKNLIQAVVKIPDIALRIHGGGEDLLELSTFAKDFKNVEFTGRYEPKELPDLYTASDLIWAVYPNKDYNVKYAISNKFHESVDYHVPCVFANNTLLGDLVERENIGFTVDPYDVQNIYETFKRIVCEPNLLQSIRQNIIKYADVEDAWNVQFSKLKVYIDSFM